jgi:hypothetical protein
VLSRERWPEKGDLILYALSLPKFSGVVAALCCTSGGNEVLPNFFNMLMTYLGPGLSRTLGQRITGT